MRWWLMLFYTFLIAINVLALWNTIAKIPYCSWANIAAIAVVGWCAGSVWEMLSANR